jgi:hypothetical protein
MIVNAEFNQHQDTDATEGPAIRLEARGLRSLCEQRQHVLLLVRGQAWRSSRHGMVFQTASTALVPLEPLGPFADGYPARHPTGARCPLGRAGQLAATVQLPIDVRHVVCE